MVHQSVAVLISEVELKPSPTSLSGLLDHDVEYSDSSFKLVFLNGYHHWVEYCIFTTRYGFFLSIEIHRFFILSEYFIHNLHRFLLQSDL